MTQPIPAWHYDGVTAARHLVSVRQEGDALVIEGFETVAFADLVPRGEDDRPVFGKAGNSGWRLGFDVPLPAAWRAQLPRPPRYGRLIDRIGLAPAIVGGIIVSALVLVGLWQAPALIAPLVPERWERAFGDALVGDLGGRACTGAEGQAVLDRLARKLTGSGRPMRVRVVDIPIPNAVALPGGQIALFSGIITQAKSPDEIAGVLGHEIGHVEHRHVMAGLIRQFGFSLLLGGSGKGADYANALLAARYGREAESEADDYAIKALAANRISTRPTADFFARMAGPEPTGKGGMDSAFSWLSNHPASRVRRDAFRAADARIADPQPSMSAADWAAVRSICRDKPKTGG